jgi:hypothetical protein
MESLREAGGTREVRVWRLGFEQSMTDVRASLGDAAFAAAWAEGRAMSMEQAVAYALEGAAQA